MSVAALKILSCGWPLDNPLLPEGGRGSLLVLEGSHNIGIKFVGPWSFVDWRNSEILGLGGLWDGELVLEGSLGGRERRSVVSDIVINTEVWHEVVSLWCWILGSINWSPGNTEI